MQIRFDRWSEGVNARALAELAEAAGISVELVEERAAPPPVTVTWTLAEIIRALRSVKAK